MSEIRLEAWGGSVSVICIHDFPLSPCSVNPHAPPPPPDFVYESEHVEEPCWFMRMLGDSLERRIERAKAKVTRRAHAAIAQRVRMSKAAEAAA